jgi:hypothetical protein
VADNSGNGSGDVIVNRTGRRTNQGIDELALALLELTHHDDPDAGVLESSQCHVQACPEILPVFGANELEAVLNELDQLSGGRWR